jgi:splicing factor 3B subunit 3
LGTDSGKIVILEFDGAKNAFVKVQEETFGRSGCRRVVPGQLLAADPRGRAILISALEKQKFAYILNRDAMARLTISSPQETHKSHVITIDIVGVDVGYEHPQFAALEMDYGPVDQDHTAQALHSVQRKLVFYQLDLGLNNIIRVKEIPVPASSHRLISVLGGDDGPGGVLVCANDCIIHVKDDGEQRSVDVPRRADVEYGVDDGVLIVSHASLRTKDDFLVFAQSENGDLFKLRFIRDRSTVKELKLTYFDTIPVSNAIAVLRSGYIFAASEIGNHYCYQITSVTDDEDDIRATTYRREDGKLCIKPRNLKNTVLVDELNSMAPIWDVKVENVFKEETPQLFCLTGSGPRSALRILRQGLTVTNVADIDVGEPLAIWAVKSRVQNEAEDFVVITYASTTTVLGTAGGNVEEVGDSGFLSNVRTLHVGLVGDDWRIQVHPDGLRRIKHDGRSKEWKPPMNKKIVCATSNEKQLVLAVTGGDVYYFDANTENEIDKMNIGAGKEVVAMALQPVPAKRERARFVAIADSDNRVRLYGLDPTDLWRGFSVTPVPSRVSSIMITSFPHHGDHMLTLFIGTQQGIMFRAAVDATEGIISDVRRKLLGTKPVKFARLPMNGAKAVLGISSRSWLMYSDQQQLKCQPLSYPTLENADGFITAGADSAVGISKSRFHIFQVTPGDMFNQRVIPLRYTPRQSAFLPAAHHHMVVIEADHNAVPFSQRAQSSEPADDAMQVDDANGADSSEHALPDAMFGTPHPGTGQWASCVRLVDVTAPATLHALELDNNEAAISLCCLNFRDHTETFICVGTAKDLELTPRRVSHGGYIHVYVVDAQNRLVLLHKKEVEEVPQSLSAYQGRLLAGVGSVLRIYDLGKRKKQLLRKCEAKVVPNQIVNIAVDGERITVADVQESVFFVRYNRADNSLYVMADDIVPRWVTSQTLLDYNTVAGGDKFGNIFVSRLPERVSSLEDDPTGSRFQWEQQYLNGAPYKLEPVCNFYVGETVTRVVKTTLTPGGSEVILYATVSGALGVLLPFSSREDVDLFTRLEMAMRTEAPPLSGRDHLAFRSYYFPVKSVVDGDLCEQFSGLTSDKQHKIAQDLERETHDVTKKIDDMHDSI